jgi:Mn2+/Fe2+ NRAMP family transporter
VSEKLAGKRRYTNEVKGQTLKYEIGIDDSVERSWTRRLGPGLITGAADDDPSGIGKYSQAGAQFGDNLPTQARSQLRRITFDTWIGMGVSNVIAFFIVLTAAATLHVHRIDVKTSAHAARALEPIAGHFAYALFAVGIIGTGLLALPVLAGSAAYAAAGSFRWRRSLALHLTLAREFYTVIALSIVVGVAITLMHLDPIQALYWSVVVNGLTAVPIMIITMIMAGNRRIMGEFAVGGVLAWGGWLATFAMVLAAVGMFVLG